MKKPLNNPNLQEDIAQMMQYLCDKLRLAYDDVFCKGRQIEKVEPRQMITYILYKGYNEHGLTTANLGYILDIDHATVLNSIKVVENMKDCYPDYERRFTVLMEAANQFTPLSYFDNIPQY